MDLKDRKSQIATHPRVTFHTKGTRCTALTSARSGVGTHYHPDPEVRAAKQKHARCKSIAHWRFKALKKSHARDGDYCWNHLFSQGLFSDMAEEIAMDAWWTKKYGGES